MPEPPAPDHAHASAAAAALPGQPESAAAGQGRLALVTGPSGAGRSTALRALEDLGFEAIDNLPLALLSALLRDGLPARPLALGLDARTRGFAAGRLVGLRDRLARRGMRAELLYLDCREDVLLRRFSETRRRHPLSPGEPPEQGIAREYALLRPLRAAADVLIDTSDLSPHELRAEIDRWFGGAPAQRLAIALHSFSYRRGLPQGLDMALDCRFLRNPHWQPDLRPLDGRATPVAEHVAGDPRFAGFMTRIEELLAFLLPAWAEEGKTHLSLGFGCTGGRHRSVAVAEALARALAQQGWRVSIRHRELERAGSPAAGLPPEAEERQE